MAEFAGYDMPISYDEKTGGMIKEHLAVRQHMGMFDVSHMGEFWLTGVDATRFLSYVCTRPFEGLQNHRAQYCLLCNESGGIIDDIIVYRFDASKYWVVVNASNIQKDFQHLQKAAKAFNVSLQDVSEKTALIAVQGPKAAELFSKLIEGSDQLRYYSFMTTNNNWIVGRTGYTGEDGFEVFLPTSQALELWGELERHDVVPIGLGARDTLRLEVGFPLYGHELSEDLLPMETFSAFAVDLKNNFMGATQSRTAPRYIPIAVLTKSPKPIRSGEKLFLNSQQVGWITSGSMSPMLRTGMGLALVNADTPLHTDSIFLLDSAGKPREAVRTQTPFVETSRVKRRAKGIKAAEKN
jgi:aminomethyltransferase